MPYRLEPATMSWFNSLSDAEQEYVLQILREYHEMLRLAGWRPPAEAELPFDYPPRLRSSISLN